MNSTSTCLRAGLLSAILLALGIATSPAASRPGLICSRWICVRISRRIRWAWTWYRPGSIGGWNRGRSGPRPAADGVPGAGRIGEATLRKDQGDVWDSGRIETEQSLQIIYAGKPLASEQACWWKVRVWDEAGHVSRWSQPGAGRWGSSLQRCGKRNGSGLTKKQFSKSSR